MARVIWFRRDLRLQDNPALNAALRGAEQDGDGSVMAFYAMDNGFFNSLGGVRQHSLAAGLRALSASIADKLQVRHEPASVAVLEAARLIAAKVVHAAEAFDPQGVAEQNAVGEALAAEGIRLSLTGSYYAVNPGSVRKGDGTNYRVYTPFFRAWADLAQESPVALWQGNTSWYENGDFNQGVPVATKEAPFEVVAGEEYALATWRRFKKRALAGYSDDRNRADMSGTSRLSSALAHGEIHPRTLLADLGDSSGEIVFRKEIAWREFYADVLWHNPQSEKDYYEPRFRAMRYDTGKLAEQRLTAWQEGKTGYPMVDAGMRQLLTEGWMHNRVRMIVASFLIKDLHLEWQRGAAWFEQNLSDFDPASNSHGWQWTAGCGTDASPYYRVFNPILQGHKFDPAGDYVRKYIPELRHIAGGAVHEPWVLLDGLSHGYPEPIIEHSAERNEALARLEELKVQERVDGNR